IDRIGKLVLKELRGIGAKAGYLQLVHDAGALCLVDMTIGARRGDHGAHQNEGEVGAYRLGMETGIGRRRQEFGRPALSGLDRVLASLVILVGLVTEAGDGCETAELQRGARDLAPPARAKKNAGDGDRGKRIVLGKLGDLAGAVAHGATGAGHLRTEELVKQLL